MQDLRVVTELLKITILSLLLAAGVFAAIHPTKVGWWLQLIDTARYEYLDCDDCNDPL